MAKNTPEIALRKAAIDWVRLAWTPAISPDDREMKRADRKLQRAAVRYTESLKRVVRLKQVGPGLYEVPIFGDSKTAMAIRVLDASVKVERMDPDANLQEQEQLYEAQQVRSARMRELRTALMVWLRNGGFEPKWSSCPRATRYFAGQGVGGSIPPEHYR